MSTFAKHILRRWKASPLQPLLIVCALAIATASVLLACKVSFHLYRDTRHGNAHAVGELTVTLSPESDARLLFTEYAEELVGEDARVLGEFKLTGIAHFGEERELLTLSASNFEKADEFYQFKFTSYREFNEENRTRAIILSEETAALYDLSAGDTFAFTLLGQRYEWTVEAIALEESLPPDCAGVIDVASIEKALAAHSSAIASLSGNFEAATLLRIDVFDEARTEEIAARLSSHPFFADTEILQTSLLANTARMTNQVTLIVAFAVCFLVLTLSGILLTGALGILQKERRRDTALFMTAGAERRHLNALQYLESAFFGVLGALGGLLCALPLYALLERMEGTDVTLSFTLSDIPIALFAAPLFILFLTFIRTLRAKCLTLSELLSGESHRPDARSGIRWLAFFALLFFLLLAAVYLTPVQWRYPIAILLILDTILLLFLGAPHAMRLLATLVYKALSKRKQPCGVLLVGAANVQSSHTLRHVGRLLCATLALMIPISLCTGVVAREQSHTEALVDCSYIALGADAPCEELLCADAGVLECFRFTFDRSLTTVYSTNVEVFSAEEDTHPYIHPSYAPTRLPKGDEIVLSSGVANLYGAKVGDCVTFRYGSRMQEFTVIEIVDAFPHFVFTDRSYVGRDNELLCIRTAEGEDGDALFARLSNVLELRGALLSTQQSALRPATRRIGNYVSLIQVTVLAAFLSTLIGIGNQLVSSVRAREKDLFAMRAAGMTRAHTRRLLFTELLLLFAAACLIAIPCGLFLCAQLDTVVNSFGADLFY